MWVQLVVFVINFDKKIELFILKFQRILYLGLFRNNWIYPMFETMFIGHKFVFLFIFIFYVGIHYKSGEQLFAIFSKIKKL
jgi:hypothetical protein